jgi:hypothetical protein
VWGGGLNGSGRPNGCRLDRRCSGRGRRFQTPNRWRIDWYPDRWLRSGWRRDVRHSSTRVDVDLDIAILTWNTDIKRPLLGRIGCIALADTGTVRQILPLAFCRVTKSNIGLGCLSRSVSFSSTGFEDPPVNGPL